MQELDFLPDGFDPLAYRILLLKAHLRLCIDEARPLLLADASSEEALDALLVEVVQALSMNHGVKS